MSWNVQPFVEMFMMRRLFLAVMKFLIKIKSLEGLFWAFWTITLENMR